MKFAWIPPGEFQMGCDLYEAETPAHKVSITHGFYLAAVPVTQAQWQAVMDSNPSQFKGDDRPVENVSWDDCQTFCQKLGRLTGKRLRLPTEAEWEYACRAGAATDYYNGDGEQALGEVGWFINNSDSQTHPVGRKTPNAWGLFDMHGNVWQWCEDWYGPYADLGATDPVRLKKDAENARIVRGGAWSYDAWGCRAACRFWYAPWLPSPIIGVRLAASPE
jgi:formylglycine-generating enzyme required for sulfatase activity